LLGRTISPTGSAMHLQQLCFLKLYLEF
jgi:hypothetical protein